MIKKISKTIDNDIVINIFPDLDEKNLKKIINDKILSIMCIKEGNETTIFRKVK